MTKKYFTILSGIFFILTILPFSFATTTWGDKLFTLVINISLYLPLFFGGLGLIFGLLGEKGLLKQSLVFLNILGICIWGVLLFVGIYGFQQP